VALFYAYLNNDYKKNNSIPNNVNLTPNTALFAFVLKLVLCGFKALLSLSSINYCIYTIVLVKAFINMVLCWLGLLLVCSWFVGLFLLAVGPGLFCWLLLLLVLDSLFIFLHFVSFAAAGALDLCAWFHFLTL
jgi:hypothetical protein